MEEEEHSARQLEEKMRVLWALIQDGKISVKKQMELQEEYCFLQRDYELLTNKR